MTGTILDEIVATKRAALARAQAERPIEEWMAAAADRPPTRDFHAAIVRPPHSDLHLIAELKRRSPSAGLIRPDFEPAELARVYRESGATAISVLTDEPYFDGRLRYLQVVKDAVDLPVLRKDFIIDAYQVYESRAAGADAILLIGEILEATRLQELLALAEELSLTALVEIHEPERLEALLSVLEASSGRGVLVGINNRDLKTQTVDLDTTARLAPGIPAKWPIVSESGVHGRADVRRLAKTPAKAILVGETLLKHSDPGRKIAELLGRV